MTAPNESSLDDFQLNTIIANRYRIDARLAKGGMATVYRATDLTLSRTVAIKILKAPKATDDPGKLTARFKLEAESLAKLNHRHIVTIFDYGEMEDGGYFLAMEFVDGPSLSALIRQERLAPDRAVRIIMQVCKALRYSHKRGIVHRDLKPGNILVAKEEDEEIAKLVDFGLVKLAEDDALTQHGLILGTVHCMAPEQIRGGKIDPRTDIYAIGVVLFRLVVGQYPYNSKQTAEVLAAHLHAQIPSFSSFDPNLLVPPGLEEVVRKCLQKNPANRYESATDLVQDLAACLQIPPEQFVSVSLVMNDVSSLDQRSTRNVVLGGLMGLAALVVLGGVATIAVAVATGSGDVERDAVVEHVEAPPPPPPLAGELEPSDEIEPEVEAGAAEGAEAEAAPETEAEPARPEPEPVVAAPKPPPKPRPAPTAAPAPAPDPNDGIAAVEAPKPAPKPAPQRSVSVLLNDVAVSKAADRVVVTLKMSNSSVPPLHFAAEVAGGAFAKQYQVNFRGGGNGLGASSVVVGHELVESVSIAEASGILTVVVNSRAKPAMSFERSGSEYRIVVTK